MEAARARLVSLTTVVELQEDRLALVHIPLELYPFFLDPILQVLFHEIAPITETQAECRGCDSPVEASSHDQPAFLNLSITPVECSIMCPRQLADEYFAPLVERFFQISSSTQSRLSISKDDFIAMQVYGEGLEAGQRVLELTTPLAMAGISIFFISTYFADYIIVPLKSKSQVIEVLENRGFKFETSTEAFINNPNGTFSPVSSLSASTLSSPPATPPPSSLNELQKRTFSSLRRNSIIPSVDTSLRLVQCAAHRRYSSDASSIAILRDALTTALVVDKPRFLSLTLTAADPAASLLLEHRLLARFSSDPTSPAEPDDDSSLLLGSKEDILFPITLDLRKLPLEATGIVCGVASRLADATHARTEDNPSISTPPPPRDGSTGRLNDRIHTSTRLSKSSSHSPGRKSTATNPPTHHLQPGLDTSVDAVEISFLSTARAGTIIVGEHELHRAMDALEAESYEPEKAIEALEL
ncbi:ACT domain-containing protein [Aspergillus lucknowensis]|uniref:CASTOR ACT domain-containing protein n=1 Tax=Aspergillus lucknowensis TaxID=176173 RepID=A0ABR4LDD9_9EURO